MKLGVSKHVHQNGNRRTVCYHFKPLLQTCLARGGCKVGWTENHGILGTCGLTVLDHVYGIINILCRRARNNGTVLIARIVQRLSLAFDQLVTLGIAYEDGLSCAAQDDQTLHAALDQEERVCGLCVEIEGW